MKISTLAACSMIALGFAGFVRPSQAATLVAHWKLDTATQPYMDLSANNISLYQDPATSTALPGTGPDGAAAVLRWSNPPGVSTRLYATNAPLQTDSFGFSIWLKPNWLNPGDNILVKEMAFDGSAASYSRMAWQLHLLGDNGDGTAQLELIVRGDNRAAGDFFGVVLSSTSIPLTNGAASTWFHIAGGYDALTGELNLFIDGVEATASGSPGAHNSDGSALALGTGKNGTDFVTFAASATIDDVQMYNGKLSSSEVAFLKANPGRAIGESAPAPTVKLKAHWKLDDLGGATFADASGNNAVLALDSGTTPPLTGPGNDGFSALLAWSDPPGVSTRLQASSPALQTDSFGFSFWIQPTWLDGWNNLLLKEMPTDSTRQGWAKMAWQLHLLGDNGSQAAPLELVVRGDNVASGDFFGTAVSSTALPLRTGVANWIHIAGGYDAGNGALRLFVNGVQNVSFNSSPGARNSAGGPVTIGTGKNGSEWITFAAGTYVDDMQIYDGPLSASEVAYLIANPGKPLPGTAAPRITSFSFDPATGAATLTFDSASGTLYEIQASAGLTGFVQVTSVAATGATTTVNVTKATLDSVFGSGPRPHLFFRIKGS